MTWIIYALLSAISAAFVAIFGKLGLEHVNATAATAIRSVIMSALLIAISISTHKLNGFALSGMGHKGWIFIILSAIAGAASWLFYFEALSKGPATGVVALDRLSLVFVVFLSALILGEALTIKSIAGAALIVGGAYLLVI